MKYLFLSAATFFVGFTSYAGEWLYKEKECPEPQNYFATVTEHVPGTNNTVYCRIRMFDMKEVEYIDCTNTLLKIQTHVLLHRSFLEILDIQGNPRCLKKISLLKVF